MRDFEVDLIGEDDLPEEEVQTFDLGDLDEDESDDFLPETVVAAEKEEEVPAPTDDEVMEVFKNDLLMAKVRATQQVASFLKYVVADIRLLLKKQPTVDNLITAITRLETVQPPITAVTLALNADKKDLRERILRALGTPHIPTPRAKKAEVTDEEDLADDEYDAGDFEDIDFEGLGIDPGAPTTARPGTEEKVLVLGARYAAGVPLWHDEDTYDHEHALSSQSFSLFKRA